MQNKTKQKKNKKIRGKGEGEGGVSAAGDADKSWDAARSSFQRPLGTNNETVKTSSAIETHLGELLN